MVWFRRARFRLRTLFDRGGLEQQLDEELQFHLEMQANANVRLGMSAVAAETLARRQFGNLSQHKDDYRDRWGARHVEAFWQDLRTGLRRAWTERGTSLLMAAALALGIGISTAVFAVGYSVVVHPLPYAQPDRLVRLQAGTADRVNDRLFSAPEIRDLRAHARSLDGVAEFHYMYFILLDGQLPQRVQAGVVSANFFDVAGVEPLLGRTFREGEDREGAPGAIVISNRYWHTQLGGDPRAIGHVVQLNDRAHTIVGVLPPLPAFPEEADIYLPTGACPLRISDIGDQQRDMHLVSALARVTPEARGNIGAVQSDLAHVVDRLAADYPSEYAGDARPILSAVSAHEDLTKQFRPTLSVLMASALFLFLSLCSSTGALALANALRRRRSVLMQAALGAWRGRLLRQFTTEALVLAGAGAIVGLVVAFRSLPPLVELAGRFTSRASEIRIDEAAVLFAVALAVLASLLLGAVVVFSVSGRRTDGLAVAPERHISARHPLFRGLIVLQIAVSFALTVGAGLTLRSVSKLEQIPTGYQTADVLTLRVSHDFIKYPTFSDMVGVSDRVLRAARAIPGVESASISGALPLMAPGNVGESSVEIRDGAADVASSTVSLQSVSTGHFATTGIGLLEGRDFTTDDNVESPAVAIVSSGMARRYWPGASAVGRQIRVGESGWATIVGVVGDARQRLNEAPMDEVFRPLLQLPLVNNLPSLSHHLFVRSALDRTVLEALLRDAVRGVEPQQPIDLVLTLENAREYSVAPFRTMAVLIAIFAAIGMTISTIGVGGVVSASVQARTREIGLQMALGATRRTVIGDVLKEGLRLTAGGLAVGLVLAFVLSQALTTLLFGVPPRDIETFGGVALLLTAVTAMACFIPARRASRVDPSVALRAD